MWGFGPGWGQMGPWGGHGWWGPIGLVMWVIIFALVIAALIWFIRAMTHSAHSPSAAQRRSRGLDVLEERYARGEIKRDEYLEKKRDLGA